MIEPLDEITARKTVRDYVCSTCWGHLILADFASDRRVIVECHQCGKDTKGYVTKDFVERRRAESRAERIEVDALLQDLGIIEKDETNKSTEEIISELGF